MNTLSAAISDERPLLLRGRPDLVTEPIDFQGTRYWSVKDPLSLRYYQLCDEELFVLKQADGHRSFEEIKEKFERRFAPRKLASQELYAFLGTLHREGLVTSPVPGQADQLFERHQAAENRKRWQNLSNVLAIRFRGINPDSLLDVIYPQIRWMFSRYVVATSLLFIFAAVLSLAVFAGAFVRRLPRFESFMSFENLLLMVVVLAVCKILHELGHALTCKHFGGHCHELGVMFLVFTPCLYCNVSEAWMIRNKWQRIAVSAAGIYVELVLAATCTFLWWFSQPGTANSIFLNVMFVCSAGTLLFNGNPLLRYDGYFMLADLVELPNLQQQAQSVLRRILVQLLGIEVRETWTVAQRGRFWIAVYGIASLVYRWVLVVGILLLVYSALKPYRLESLTQLLAIFVVGGMVVTPMIQAARFMRDSRFKRHGRVSRVLLLVIAVVGCGALLGRLPVSWRVAAPVVIEPANATPIYVTAAGTLQDFTAIGTKVQAGDVLVRLADDALLREIAELQGQCRVQDRSVQQLQKLRIIERGAAGDGPGAQVETARQALANTKQQLKQKLSDYERLTIVAPTTGTILPARLKRDDTRQGQLSTWSGTPLDERNIGSLLQADTAVCVIGSADNMKAVAVVEQEQIERVAIGQEVSIIVDELHDVILAGKVSDIARVTMEEVPPELIAKGLLPEDSTTSYAINITLPSNQTMPLLWSSGRAKITVPSQTLAEFVWQRLCDTFRLDL